MLLMRACMQVHGSELFLTDIDKYDYICKVGREVSWRVEVCPLVELLHLRGVCTVVLKLQHMCAAVFVWVIHPWIS